MKKLFKLFSAFFLVLSLLTSCTKKEKDELVTLKFFSNLPNRRSGQGLIEQKIIDQYMLENPNIKIVVESLWEEAYKIKFKAYCMEELPDIVSIWGQPAFLQDVMNSGILAQLNEEDYQSYDFYPSSLEGFKSEGRLYGLPRNTDIACFYYNERMFYDYDWDVPQSFEELLALADDMNYEDVIPLALDGDDGWPVLIFISDIFYSLVGNDYEKILNYAFENGDFSNKYIRKSIEIFLDCVERGLFQKNFCSDDYGTAQGLFLTGKAAMYYMGSWEVSMCNDPSLPEKIKENIRMFKMPSIENMKKNKNDIHAWYGGGYAVSEKSKNKEEALKFFNYMFDKNNLSKLGIQNSVGLSAQREDEFIEKNENILMKELVQIVSNAKSFSGTPINDRGTSHFKLTIETNIQRLVMGDISIDDFILLLNEACLN